MAKKRVYTFEELKFEARMWRRHAIILVYLILVYLFIKNEDVINIYWALGLGMLIATPHLAQGCVLPLVCLQCEKKVPDRKILKMETFICPHCQGTEYRTSKGIWEKWK